MSQFDFSIIKYLRQRKFLSCEQLAQRCNVSRQTVANIERGKYVPSLPVLQALARELEIHHDELVGYCLRRDTEIINPTIFSVSGADKKGLYYNLGDTALAYIELPEGYGYNLKKYQIQDIYVVQGQMTMKCCTADRVVAAGEFVSCNGVDCLVSAKSGPVKLVIVSIPNTNSVSVRISTVAKPAPESLFLFKKLTDDCSDSKKPFYNFSVIKDLRYALGLSIEDLAQASSLSVATVMAIEQNQRCPSLLTLKQISECCNIHLDELMQLAGKGYCSVFASGRETFTGIAAGSGESVDLHVNSMRHRNYRMGCLINGTDHTVNVPVENVFIADEKFIFVIDGKQTMTIGEDDYKLASGQGILFDGRAAHCYSISPGTSSFAVFSVRQESLYRNPADNGAGNLFRFGDVM